MEKSSQYQSQKAKRAIIDYILNEQLEPHEALPGELVLTELFSMSRYASSYFAWRTIALLPTASTQYRSNS